jgi:ribosomal protein S18 acetylase RimI-like enzyme
VTDNKTITVVRADAVPAAALCDAYNAAFADYVVTFPTLDEGAWRAVVERQGVDLRLSVAACRGDEVMAFGLVTPRAGQITRIATMGARPKARGSGAAPALLDQLLTEARARSDANAELEVFAQNERAFRLYRSRGFQPVCTLCGFETAGGGGGDAPVVEMSREDGTSWAAAFERDERMPLPWQVTGAAIACAPAVQRIWRLAQAQIAWLEGVDTITVMSVLDRNTAYADATRLLGALAHRFPAHKLRAPQLQREVGPADAFERAGWARSPLFQYLMRCPLRETT